MGELLGWLLALDELLGWLLALFAILAVSLGIERLLDWYEENHKDEL